jgi:ppGpp synthetase/RelA/SpoT-type nucleotidyltranferase
MAINDLTSAIEKSSLPSRGATFDFTGHRQQAIGDYEKVQNLYEECAHSVQSVLRIALRDEHVKVQTITARGKGLESFGDKAAKPADDRPNEPKYPDPLRDITDMAGVRVIVYLLDHRDEVDKLIKREFNVREKKPVLPGGDEAPGYESIHYLVAFRPNRHELTEYRRFRDLIVEIQVCTVLQHAWAEIEHGIRYKPEGYVSESIRRRLTGIAATLGMADETFQDVENDSRTQDSTEGLSPTT